MTRPRKREQAKPKRVDREHLRIFLLRRNACCSALTFLGLKTPKQMWNKMTHAGWLLWFFKELEIPKKTQIEIVLAGIEALLPYARKGETRKRIWESLQTWRSFLAKDIARVHAEARVISLMGGSRPYDGFDYWFREAVVLVMSTPMRGLDSLVRARRRLPHRQCISAERKLVKAMKKIVPYRVARSLFLKERRK